MDDAPSNRPQALDRRGYQLAIFDFDGTLADSFPWFIGVLNGVADRYGFNRVRPDDVEQLRGYDARQIMRHLRVPSWKLPLRIV